MHHYVNAVPRLYRLRAQIAKARELGVAIMSPDWLRNLCNRTAEGTALRTFGRIQSPDCRCAADANHRGRQIVRAGGRQRRSGTREVPPGAALHGGGATGRIASRGDGRRGGQQVPVRAKAVAVSWRLCDPCARCSAQPVIGCDLLKVPTSYTGNGKDVLVTHDGVFGYTAYNAVLNQADVAR